MPGDLQLPPHKFFLLSSNYLYSAYYYYYSSTDYSTVFIDRQGPDKMEKEVQHNWIILQRVEKKQVFMSNATCEYIWYVEELVFPRKDMF